MRRRQATAVLAVAVVCFSLTACASLSSRMSTARTIASAAGFEPVVLRTTTFRMIGFYRIRTPGRPVVVYIEGDGLAWMSRTQPPPNPTPLNPLALRLAALDQSDNVAYVARPCQYVELSAERRCDVPYWTRKRFAEEVIASVNEAVDIIASRANADRIHLVGYSGGAVVAALVAARRRDIASLRTVAGYLDHVALNRARKVSPLKGSLDAIEAAHELTNIPQIHYVGDRDKVIPEWVARNFGNAVGNERCLSIRVVDASHDEGWDVVWSKYGSEQAVCR